MHHRLPRGNDYSQEQGYLDDKIAHCTHCTLRGPIGAETQHAKIMFASNQKGHASVIITYSSVAMASEHYVKAYFAERIQKAFSAPDAHLSPVGDGLLPSSSPTSCMQKKGPYQLEP